MNIPCAGIVLGVLVCILLIMWQAPTIVYLIAGAGVAMVIVASRRSRSQ